MIFTYDSTTSGAKRIDWDLTCSDLTKEEDKELQTLLEKPFFGRSLVQADFGRLVPLRFRG